MDSLVDRDNVVDREHWYGICFVHRAANELRKKLGMPLNYSYIYNGGRRYKCSGCGANVLTCDRKTHKPICEGN